MTGVPRAGSALRRGEHSERREARARARARENVEPQAGFAVVVVTAGNGDGVVGDDALAGGGADKVKATGERCRGRVMTTQRVVNAFMSRVAL